MPIVLLTVECDIMFGVLYCYHLQPSVIINVLYQDKQQELERVSSSIKAAHVDKSTEKQIATVMVARSEETPTASVRPTNIVGMLQTE